MKSIFLMFAGLFAAMTALAQQTLVLEPAKPTAGATVTVHYNPASTPLKDVKDFQAVAYLLEGKLPVAVEIPLQLEKGTYVGKFKTNDTTRAIFISFWKDEVRDNNNDEGYYSLLHDKGGKEVPGAHLALAQGYNYASIWGMKRDAGKVAEMNKKEFSSPDAREKFHNEYLTFLSQSSEEGDKELLKAELEKTIAKKDVSESDLMRAKSLYENTFKDKEKAEAVFAGVKQRFPNGNWQKTELMQTFNKESDLQKKASLLQELIARADDADEGMVNNMTRMLAMQYSNASEFDNAIKYAALIKDKSTQASVLNSVALKLAGGGITKEPVDAAKGLQLAEKAVALLKDLRESTADKPSYMTVAQWRENMNYPYQNCRSTQAALLHQSGQSDKALAILSDVVKEMKGMNMNANEALAFVTEKVKGPAAAQEKLEHYIKEGRNTPAMKEQLKTIYLAKHTEVEWATYLDKLETEAFNNLKAELAKKMINMPAPLFSLKDLSGNQVSLASLKGKVVVVDFWATWCGPCIASFPGMQKALNKYKSNPDVAFLFIDTWEGGDDRESKVTSFIEKNKYDFHVLYDDEIKKGSNEFVVVSNFKVEGIPTKFIIDKNSNIRFKSVGYNGSIDGLVNELTAMIELAASPESAAGLLEKKKVME